MGNFVLLSFLFNIFCTIWELLYYITCIIWEFFKSFHICVRGVYDIKMMLKIYVHLKH